VLGARIDPMIGVRKLTLALVVGLGLVLALASTPAIATVPPVRCGKIKVEGNKFKVNGHRIGCDFARKWSKRYLKDREHKSGWDCASYSPEETRIAFSCRKGGKDYYAVRK
jgi:hypothetical protein